LDTKEYRFVAARPTTSIREALPGRRDETFQRQGRDWQGRHGRQNPKGCEKPGVYFHAIGGAAFIAQSVKKVLGVYKLVFGVPEAIVVEIKDFPVVVTMDAHGQSQHAVVESSSKQVLDELLAKPY
jgi:fumarate hydratase class I